MRQHLESRTNKGFAAVVIPAALLSLAFILIFVLSGCYSVGKMQRQVIKGKVTYPVEMRAIVADMFPETGYTKDSIIYKPGEKIYLPADTIEVDCDTVRSVETRIVKVPCPPSYRQVDTQYRNRYVKVYDWPALQSSKDTNLNLEKTLSAKKQENKILWWVVVILAVYTLGRWLVRIIWKINIP